MKRTITITLLVTPLLLGGCDQIQGKLGIEDAATKAAKQEEEGKAVGGACRQSGRAIEDCYSLYNWLPKAAVYAGWREMDVYMRENQIETIAPQLPPAPPPEDPNKKKKKKKVDSAEGTTGDSTDKPKEGAAPAAMPAPTAPGAAEKPAEAAKH